MRRIHSLGLLLVVVLLGTPVIAQAQGSGEAGDGRTFGPTSLVSHTVSAFSFVGTRSLDNTLVKPAGVLGQSRSCTDDCDLRAGVILPAGALVSSIELEACIPDLEGSVAATLSAVGPNESGHASLASVTTAATPGTPGCTRFLGLSATGHTVDNAANTYNLRVSLSGGLDTTRFQSVRVYYTLQVSPAPATARFADVPTNHPYFQFIEALAAAGITTGCSASPLLYCPDDPLTRGEAAVFFGKALGLQFAP